MRAKFRYFVAALVGACIVQIASVAPGFAAEQVQAGGTQLAQASDAYRPPQDR